MTIDPSRKLAGLLVPVFALRHKDDLGIGDTRSVMEAIDFCADNGIGVLQTLPINETGGDNSPYSAISSVALDPAQLCVTPDEVPDLSADQFRLIASKELLSELREGSVNYPAVKKLKHDLLNQAFEQFESKEKSGARKNEFDSFVKDNERWLAPYALFRTIVEDKNGHVVWTDWEDELKSYDSALGWLKKSDRRKELEARVRYFSYVQWIAFSQWHRVRGHADKKNVALMGDIPFGVSRYSADVWAHKELFDLEWSGGAPPETYFQGDLFTQKWGQNWGIPLYNWKGNEAENYRWWRQRVKYVTEIFHYFRIDHVLGFFRVYAFPWIPERNGDFVHLTEEEAAEKTGGLLPQFMPRSDELPDDAELNEKDGERILRVLMDASGSAGIVAEDLGVVPPYVRPLLKKLGIAGFAIPIFERHEDTREFKTMEELEPLSLATYGTHDHQPLKSYYDGLVSWWRGPYGHEGWLEVQRLMRFLGRDPETPPQEFTEELHRNFLDVLLKSHSWLAVLMVTDLLGTRQRFNEPGLAGDYNWSQRLDRTLSELSLSDEFSANIAYFAGLIGKSDRQPLSLAGKRAKSP